MTKPQLSYFNYYGFYSSNYYDILKFDEFHYKFITFLNSEQCLFVC